MQTILLALTGSLLGGLTLSLTVYLLYRHEQAKYKQKIADALKQTKDMYYEKLTDRANSLGKMN